MRKPLEAELQALVQSGTIHSVKADQVPRESGYDYMLVAPAKVVPTIKSPVGKQKIRIVVCGNMVRSAEHAKPVDIGSHGQGGPK